MEVHNGGTVFWGSECHRLKGCDVSSNRWTGICGKAVMQTNPTLWTLTVHALELVNQRVLYTLPCADMTST